MGKSKIYLSLEDLHKLYGLSDSVIKAIKAKRKKRRKKKINNLTMGNKPSDSQHMVGSSNALSIATQQLNQANVTKRIEDINRNNLMIQQNKINPNVDVIPMEITIYNKIKNKQQLTPDELLAYEEIQNVMLPPLQKTKQKRTYTRRKVFEVAPELKNSLASISQSRTMGRDNVDNTIVVDYNDGIGSTSQGASSDQFVGNDVLEELLPTQPSASASAGASDFVDASAIDYAEQELQAPDVTASQPNVMEYVPIKNIKKEQLINIAKENEVNMLQGDTKKSLYFKLLDLGLLPRK